MTQQTNKIPISSIILDEDIYPRKGIDHRRVGIFAENIRDGFKFEPIEVEPDPDKPGRYRLPDGAKKAIGPKQLTEDEARDTALRAYTRNSSLNSAEIGKAIGRARRIVNS